MYRVIFAAFLFLAATEAQVQRCKQCGTLMKPVCGKDGNTYASFCVLKQQECMMNKVIGFECDGECPCDPAEIIKLDPVTVKQLQNFRQHYQLEGHEKEEETVQDRMTFDILDTTDVTDDFELQEIETEIRNQQKETELKSDDYYKKNNGNCSVQEMADLPARLIDWFHVLKTNERIKGYSDQGIEQEPIIKEMNFMEAKLKSVYSALACTPQDDEKIEKEVCLTPVQWMFERLDANNDKKLSAVELSDIAQINNENCIKPFLKNCDADKDGKVVLKEFCKCLCVTPPCTKIMQTIPSVLLRGEPRPVAGLFTPVCDEDGFFMPTQCNTRLDECWCVDRNGNEYEGTRQKGKVACIINTKENPKKTLIALDMKKENRKGLV